MSAVFDSSTTKLNINDGGDHHGKSKENSKRIGFLTIVLLVLVILSIIFVVLYVKTDQKNEKLKTENSELSSKLSNGKATTTPSGEEKRSSTKSPLTSTIDPSLPYANVRLPKNVYPTLYDLHLKVFMNNKSVTGTVRVTTSAKTATKYFIIHAYDYTTINGVLKDNTNKELEYKDKFLYEPNQFYVIELNDAVPAGVYYLEFDFSYTLKKSLKGFYQSYYKSKKNEEILVAATQFQPVSARIAFPCFDEPALRANFSVKISHTQGYFALTNMPSIESKIDQDTNLVYNRFEVTPSMPTYLVAFAITDFGGKSVNALTKTPTNMTFYAPKDQLDQIDYAKTVGKEILEYFEEYYNVSYPLPKADMIAIPDFAAGAMENWGLITYRSSALLYDKVASGSKSKLRVASIVAHELAHQWFGNIVTMEWWSDLWLNEGFASYVEYLGMDHAEPDWNATDFQVTSDMASGLSLDALVSSHPIYIPVNHPSEIDEIFDSISYSKGGSVLRMLDNFLSTPVFKKGLTRYLNKYSYGNAKTRDLFDILTEVSFENGDNYNVTEIMSTWVLQMGFPVITVTKKGSVVTLTQERFYKDPNPDLSQTKFVSPYNYTWIVPFNYVKMNISDINNTKSVGTNRTWLRWKGGSITVPSNDIIVKGNHDQYGFFRVNYDQVVWEQIGNILMTNHQAFTVKDRAGILADAFALAESGRLDYCTAISLFDYIDKEREYLPWRAAIDGISIIGSSLTRTKPGKKYYKEYLLKKVTKLFNEIGFKDEDNLTRRYLQILIVGLACSTGHKECLNNTKEMFNNWKAKNQTISIHGDFHSLVYYYGVYNGDVSDWEFILEKYKTNQIASEKTKLMYALAATQEAWLLDRYLNYGLNESVVKAQDVSYVFSYVSNYNPIGRYLAWGFMKEKWNIIEERFVESFFTMRRIFSSVTSGFTTQYELDQMKDFVKTRISNQGSAKQIIKQSEEKIKARIEWISRNEKSVEECLKKRVVM